LERLVVGELDDVRLRLEERLVNVHLRVAVYAIVSDVEVLNDLRFRELINNTST
jgi:hypothetical protein